MKLLKRALEVNKINWLREHRKIALIAGPLVIFLVVIIIYIMNSRYVSTDNAYIQASRTQISSNVSGQVIKIHVGDNNKVKKGDILFELDAQPYKLIVEEAAAKVSKSILDIKALKANYRKYKAELEIAKNTLAYQKKEFIRQKELLEAGFSSAAQFDQAKHAFDNAYQQVHAYEQQLAYARASLKDDPDIELNNHPTIQQAQAYLKQVQLNLYYTVIKAPADGIVTKVEQLQVGDYITSTMPVFALVSEENLWIEANFKETELTNVRPGQEATIAIDMYPGEELRGKVMSISPGTGSSFSLLPPENATGNWVKVVQRVPVRISINKKSSKLLPAGSSVFVEIDTRSPLAE